MLATGAGEGGRHLSKGRLPDTPAAGSHPPSTPTPQQAGGEESFYKEWWWEGVLHAETSLTVIFKFVITSLSSSTSTVLGAVNLQLQGLFVPISLRPVLGIVAAHVLGTVWSSCS